MLSRDITKKQKYIILGTVILLASFGFWGLAEAEYYSSGTLVSQNLLYSQYVNSVENFGYDATIPSGTSLKVQFSQDKTNWYNSAGVSGGWDVCSEGGHLIDLLGLNWSGPNFYYKMELTSDGNNTPVLDEILLYTPYLIIKGELRFKGGTNFQ